MPRPLLPGVGRASNAHSATAAPRLGPGILEVNSIAGRSAARRRRHQKVGLWSAVALQQHFTFSGGVQALTAATAQAETAAAAAAATATPSAAGRGHVRSSRGEAPRPTPLASLPPANAAMVGAANTSGDGLPRLTLAQKMRLVPAPPPPPTQGDWHAVETRALLRAQQRYEDDRRAARRRSSDGGPSYTHHDNHDQHHHHYGGHSSQDVGYVAATTAQTCAICRDPFYLAPTQGQIILSCSHVFHETCFRQFEGMIRRQQRVELTGGGGCRGGGSDSAVRALMTRLACPECRATNYHKKSYYAGKAMAQRSAIIQMQSVVRGFLARRRCRAVRLQVDPQFREIFVETRLARLSRAWESYLAQEERSREAILVALGVRRQEAAAAFVTEETWRAMIARKLDGGAECSGVGDGTAGGQRGDSSHRTHSPPPAPPVAAALCSNSPCPICLEAVRAGLRPSHVYLSGSNSSNRKDIANTFEQSVGGDIEEDARGDEETDGDWRAQQMITEMRAAYEERARRTAAAATKTKAGAKGTTTAAGKAKAASASNNSKKKGQAPRGPRAASPSTDPAAHQKQSSTVAASNTSNTTAAATTTTSTDSDVNRPGAPRYGVILSCCGAVFHEACLGALERYSERCADLRRCPMCRAGYGRHDF